MTHNFIQMTVLIDLSNFDHQGRGICWVNLQNFTTFQTL